MQRRNVVIIAGLLSVTCLVVGISRLTQAGRKPKAAHAAGEAASGGGAEAALFSVEKKHFTDSIENLVGTIKGNTIELTFNGQEERLTDVHVRVGQSVKRETCLFELDHTKAEARMRQAKSVFERAGELQEAGGATQHDVDEASAVYAMAKKDYDDTFIYAPKDGQISQINRQVGETIGRSDVIAVLVSSEDRLVLETGVIESQLDRVIPGQTATVQIEALGNQPIEGEVQGISREVTTTGRTGTVVIALPRKVQHRLRPGLSARCDIRTIDRTTLVIPRGAYDKDKKGVYVVSATGKTALQPVELGVVTRDFYEVVSGLEEGDRIVADLTVTPVQDGAQVVQAGELVHYNSPS